MTFLPFPGFSEIIVFKEAATYNAVSMYRALGFVRSNMFLPRRLMRSGVVRMAHESETSLSLKSNTSRVCASEFLICLIVSMSFFG